MDKFEELQKKIKEKTNVTYSPCGNFADNDEGRCVRHGWGCHDDKVQVVITKKDAQEALDGIEGLALFCANQAAGPKKPIPGLVNLTKSIKDKLQCGD